MTDRHIRGDHVVWMPPYDDEISDEYLEALRRLIDAERPEGHVMRPLGEPGW